MIHSRAEQVSQTRGGEVAPLEVQVLWDSEQADQRSNDRVTAGLWNLQIPPPTTLSAAAGGSVTTPCPPPSPPLPQRLMASDSKIAGPNQRMETLPN